MTSLLIRSWIARLAGPALLVGLIGTTAGAAVVANYRDDFQADAPLTGGWQYLWNAPDGWTPASGVTGDVTTGPIGDPGSYLALMDAGSLWTADGDGTGTNHNPDRYVRLNANGGHPGGGSDVAGGNLDRFAIAAYTVGQAGVYLVDRSYYSNTNNGGSNGAEVLIHVNGDPAASSTIVPNNGTRSFDTFLGLLDAGDTVYVGFGPNGHPGSDGFNMDFSVDRLPGNVEMTRVANYRDDFSGTAFPPGWQYLWNAPDDWDGSSSSDASTGGIGDPAHYVDLNPVSGTWRVDNDTNSSNGAPGNYLNLSSVGGHPGRGSTQGEGIGNSHDRYPIAAFTVDEPGEYAILDSFFDTIDTAGNGGEVYVHVNDDAPLLEQIFSANPGIGSFDVYLGSLDAGDTIYVGLGPNGTDGSDSFDWDFTIARFNIVPEPSAVVLLLLGAFGLAAVARRRRR